MSKVKLYTKDYCPYCKAAKALLQSKGISFENIEISNSPELRTEMIALSGRKTVPQIFINDYHVGGFTDLNQLEQQGALEPLLKTPSLAV